nr:transposase [Desulfosediminicola ganghwensis]
MLYARLFCKKSEKGAVVAGVMQLSLFDIPEPEVKSVVEVPEHTRAKRGSKPLSANLPRVEIVPDL